MERDGQTYHLERTLALQMLCLGNVYHFHPDLSVDLSNHACDLLVTFHFGNGVVHVQLPRDLGMMNKPIHLVPRNFHKNTIMEGVYNCRLMDAVQLRELDICSVSSNIICSGANSVLSSRHIAATCCLPPSHAILVVVCLLQNLIKTKSPS